MPALSLTQARTQLGRMTAAAVDPTLSDDELDDLLFAARRPSLPAWLTLPYPAYTAESVLPAAVIPPDAYREWIGGRVVGVGAIVTPPVRNGHRYTATVGGTSSATAPVWPTTTGATVTDGTVTWQESGATVYLLTWDLNSAAAEGWRWKAGKVTNRISVTAGGQVLAQDQFLAHCERMITQYTRKMATTVPLRGGYRRDRLDGAANGYDW